MRPKVQDVQMARSYFVETDGRDGLKHHVGPFRTRSEAEAWIAGRISGADARRSGAAIARLDARQIHAPLRSRESDHRLGPDNPALSIRFPRHDRKCWIWPKQATPALPENYPRD